MDKEQNKLELAILTAIQRGCRRTSEIVLQCETEALQTCTTKKRAHAAIQKRLRRLQRRSKVRHNTIGDTWHLQEPLHT